ncbi:MAG: M14 family metallopeptidase [Phascolarctobacterium faecium]|uniref:M14 family metallopeptidase n=1 Tax=Phascolarctobacterium faecium TaxID=33025 RepID=UPI002E76272C|nr:M14 family metallopeptidase [Phascolarctobacterium faecium]MED9990716.1 M14 family metallopeptidase [Phascolarctobacterium faecium]
MSNTLHICGLKVERGQKLQTYLPVLDTNTKIPITIINGQNDGPTLLITAGIHGGEYPGIAAAIEISKAIKAEILSGCLIIIHPVNIRSFWERSAFVTPDDGKNLNREFPGDVNGTLSQKTAWLLSQHFFPLADFYADLHSGDIHEELYPYVYYPGLPNSEISAKARGVAMVLDMEFMVRSTATTGAYNYAAISGVPSILIERGGAGLCRREDIDAYKNDLHNIFCKLELLRSTPQPQKHTPVDVTDVIYLETDKAGCWFPSFRCGTK